MVDWKRMCNQIFKKYVTALVPLPPGTCTSTIHKETQNYDKSRHSVRSGPLWNCESHSKDLCNLSAFRQLRLKCHRLSVVKVVSGMSDHEEPWLWTKCPALEWWADHYSFSTIYITSLSSKTISTLTLSISTAATWVSLIKLGAHLARPDLQCCLRGSIPTLNYASPTHLCSLNQDTQPYFMDSGGRCRGWAGDKT